MAELKENVIEWISGSDTIALTLSQAKYINKVRKIIEKHSEIEANLVENEDGSIFCHLPLKALKLSIIDGSGHGFKKKDNSGEN